MSNYKVILSRVYDISETEVHSRLKEEGYSTLEELSEEYSEHVQQLSHESGKSAKEILCLFGAFFKGLHSKR